MNDKLLVTLINMLITLGITVVLFGIWFVIWSIIRLPIKMKDAIIKEREEASKELVQIQAAKGVEWDNYKKIQEESDKLRKAYFQIKTDHDNLKETLTKEEINKEKLVLKIRELNKELEGKQKTTEDKK